MVDMFDKSKSSSIPNIQKSAPYQFEISCGVFSCILETNVGNWASDKLLEFVEISILFYTLEVSRQVESLGLDLYLL